MNRRLTPANVGLLAACAVAASIGMALMLFVFSVGSVKVVGGLAGASVFLFAAYLSGNLRLFCIWGLGMTLPFDLSKRFGPFIMKMGGENSFRVEMSDPFILALAVFVAWDIWRGRRVFRLPRVSYVWLAIAAMGILTAIIGPYRITALHEVVRMGKVLFLFLVVCNELTTRKRILHAGGALVAGVLIQAMTALVQYITRADLGLQMLGEATYETTEIIAQTSVRGSDVFRASGFLNHPNILGAFLAMLLPLSLVLIMAKTSRAMRLFFIVTSMLGVSALITTLSRSGWVSFATGFAALMALLIFHQGMQRRSLIAAALAMVMLLSVGLVFAKPITSRIFSSSDQAMLGRSAYMKTAIGVIGAKPITGWGLNSYVFVSPPFTSFGARGAFARFGPWVPIVHNIYLLWWAETGIIGLILHLAVFGLILLRAVSNLRVRDHLLFAVNAACLAGLLGFLVDGFFSFSFRFNGIMRAFWVVAGIIFAIYYWRLRDERTRRDERRPLVAS